MGHTVTVDVVGEGVIQKSHSHGDARIDIVHADVVGSQIQCSAPSHVIDCSLAPTVCAQASEGLESVHA